MRCSMFINVSDQATPAQRALSVQTGSTRWYDEIPCVLYLIVVKSQFEQSYWFIKPLMNFKTPFPIALIGSFKLFFVEL